MGLEAGHLLKQVNLPEDLRKLTPDQLPELSKEIRQFIIDAVSLHGGHLGASLGAVELTIALHYVFNTPEDLLVWDVGHQAYSHKILTGRKDQFDTLRKKEGISGFLKIKESSYDTFGAGHSSTSISAALGMALADKVKGKGNRQHVVVIGDGALSGGMAFEALNHAGSQNTNLLVILNDNHISIDPDVGALRTHLNSLLEATVPPIPGARIKRSRFLKKSNNLFEALGFEYFGPCNGNDVKKMVTVLDKLRHIPGPKLLHIQTVKGKGYEPAEKDQITWHAPGLFDKFSGRIKEEHPLNDGPQKYQDVFGFSLLELAKKNDRIMAITPAMPSGSSLKYMMKEMPDRAIDVGIAEQHAVTLSAGMASQGMKVFCNIYSTFMQRAYDQIIHDVAVQDLPVIFCLDRAGLVGEDGVTHQGAYDIAYMRCIPNMIVSAPMDESQLRDLMYTAQLSSTAHPMTIRYPRGRGVQKEWQTPFQQIEVGKGRRITDGEKVAVLTFGHPGNWAQEAIMELNKISYFPAHFDLRFAKPLDDELLEEVFLKFPKIITIEDGTVIGGLGSAILEWANARHFKNDIRRMGIPDRLIFQATETEQRKDSGLDTPALVHMVKKLWEEK